MVDSNNKLPSHRLEIRRPQPHTLPLAARHRRLEQPATVYAAVHSNAVSLAIERSDHRAEAVVQVGPANETVNTNALVLGEHRACFAPFARSRWV